MKRHRRHHGFTLAELIVATTLTVMVTGSTVAMLRSSIAARKRTYRQTSLQTRARTAAGAVATTLRNACRLGKDEVRLVGVDDELGGLDADRVRFFSVSRRQVRIGRAESDVKEVELALLAPPSGGPPGLMQRTDPTKNPRPDGGGVVHCLADSVIAFDVAYHDGDDWLSEWTENREDWPTAIRIALAVRDPDSGEVLTVRRLVNFPHQLRKDGQSGK